MYGIPSIYQYIKIIIVMIGYYWLSSIIMLIFLLIGIEVYLDVHQNDTHLDIVSPDNVHRMAQNLADKRVDVFEGCRAA